MPKVSVLIPSYNHSKYIAQTIQSVLDQTYKDFEIIIIDDASSDNSLEIIQRFTDSRIRLYHSETNQGISATLNKLIEEAQGEYLATLASDDAFLPKKLEKQVAFLDGHPDIGAVFSYAEIINEDDKPLTKHSYSKVFNQANRTRHEWLRRFFYQGNCLCAPSVLIRKECHDKVGLYDPRYRQMQDFEFWIRLCMQYEIYVMPEELIQYRVRDSGKNASGRTPDNAIRNHFEFAMIFEHYTKITSISEISLIFDHWQSKFLTDPALIPFFVAQEALQQTRQYYWLFGLTTMHRLLADINLVNKLKIYNYNYNKFYAQIANYDIFKLYPPMRRWRYRWRSQFKAAMCMIYRWIGRK